MSAPCGMRLFGAVKDCEKPATLGWVSEVNGQLVPVCDDCRKAVRMNRTYLQRIEDPGHLATCDPAFQPEEVSHA